MRHITKYINIMTGGSMVDWKEDNYYNPKKFLQILKDNKDVIEKNLEDNAAKVEEAKKMTGENAVYTNFKTIKGLIIKSVATYKVKRKNRFRTYFIDTNVH
jgi:uncharacterized ubiquitin-like protein YukD